MKTSKLRLMVKGIQPELTKLRKMTWKFSTVNSTILAKLIGEELLNYSHRKPLAEVFKQVLKVDFRPGSTWKFQTQISGPGYFDFSSGFRSSLKVKFASFHGRAFKMQRKLFFCPQAYINGKGLRRRRLCQGFEKVTYIRTMLIAASDFDGHLRVSYPGQENLAFNANDWNYFSDHIDYFI